MHKQIPFVAALSVFAAGAAGQYAIDLDASAMGVRPFVDDSTTYALTPTIDVTEGGEFTDDLVTFSSPGGVFEGFFNDPDGTLGSSANRDTTAAVEAAATGDWSLRIDDASRGVTHEYRVGVEFSVPFAELPSFSSDTLVNGEPVTTQAWTLEGGTPAYPGGSSQIRAELYRGLFEEELDSDTLPAGAESWTPDADLSGGSEFLARLATQLEASDPDAFTITDVEALSEGAPELTFASAETEYGARRSALLVPAPAGAVGMLGLLVAAPRRRR